MDGEALGDLQSPIKYKGLLHYIAKRDLDSLRVVVIWISANRSLLCYKISTCRVSAHVRVQNKTHRQKLALPNGTDKDSFRPCKVNIGKLTRSPWPSFSICF